MSKRLFLVRANAEGDNRIKDFLKENIIAIGWMRLKKLDGLNKEEIVEELKKADYSTSNVTVGLINHFVNNMKVGDLCLIPEPDSNNVYLCEIKEDYYFNSHYPSFPHTRKVEFINKENPFNRQDFSEELNKALKPLMTVADVTHRLPELEKYIGDSSEELDDSTCTLKKELMDLLPIAIENIKEELNSEDKNRRVDASFEIIKLLKDIDMK